MEGEVRSLQSLRRLRALGGRQKGPVSQRQRVSRLEVEGGEAILRDRTGAERSR